MKKQKSALSKLALKKTAIAPLNANAQEQLKGGLTGAQCKITRFISQCNACIPATEYMSCRCV